MSKMKAFAMSRKDLGLRPWHAVAPTTGYNDTQTMCGIRIQTFPLRGRQDVSRIFINHWFRTDLGSRSLDCPRCKRAVRAAFGEG